MTRAGAALLAGLLGLVAAPSLAQTIALAPINGGDPSYRTERDFRVLGWYIGDFRARGRIPAMFNAREVADIIKDYNRELNAGSGGRYQFDLSDHRRAVSDDSPYYFLRVEFTTAIRNPLTGGEDETTLDIPFWIVFRNSHFDDAAVMRQLGEPAREAVLRVPVIREGSARLRNDVLENIGDSLAVQEERLFLSSQLAASYYFSYGGARSAHRLREDWRAELLPAWRDIAAKHVVEAHEKLAGAPAKNAWAILPDEKPALYYLASAQATAPERDQHARLRRARAAFLHEDLKQIVHDGGRYFESCDAALRIVDFARNLVEKAPQADAPVDLALVRNALERADAAVKSYRAKDDCRAESGTAPSPDAMSLRADRARPPSPSSR